MVELIRQIPGPTFLTFYAIFAAIITFVAYKFAENDNTDSYPLPEPTKVSTLDMAILTKGIKGAISVSVFNLWRKKSIEIIETKKNTLLKKLNNETEGLNSLEILFLNVLKEQQPYSKFFTYSFVETCAGVLKPNIEHLEKLRLMPDEEIKRKHKFAAHIAFALLALIGGTKLYLGLLNNRPIGFLVVLIIISFIAVLVTVKPYNVSKTQLGKKFIAASNQRFEWLKTSNDESLMDNDNLLYGIALFGVAGFAGSAMADVFQEPIWRRSLDGGDYGGSDYGSGSDSGSDSGSSDGGGSGCGGCGGGD